jgi:hypothetical protein
MYHLCVQNYYCDRNEEDDERIDARMTTHQVFAWMLDSDMRHVLCYGSVGHFLLQSEGCPGCDDDGLVDAKAFLKDARRVLGIADDADDDILYDAYTRATPDQKSTLVQAYARHMDAQAWIDQVVSWCALHPGREHDMVGNESTVGTIAVCSRWPPLSKI